jgi:hypothetical protein
MFLTEFAEPQLLVIYPGRFQPFHKGHAAVYQGLVGKYGRNNVYIATAGKTGDDKHPFTFSEKLYFMQLQGVPADRVVEATQPYQIDTVISGGRLQVANRNNTIVVFAVSQKDMAEDPRFKSWTKKDGTPTYFQQYPNDIKAMEDMTKHAYILTVPVQEFTVLGQVVNSASAIRNLYAESDVKTRQQIITDVFGKYTAEAEQIFNNKLLEAVAPKVPKLASSTKLQPVGKVKEISEGEGGEDPERYKLLSKARIAHPTAQSDEEALALYLNDKEQNDFDNVEHEEHNLESEVAELYNRFKELRFDVDELQKLKESRIIDPDKVDVWFRPGSISKEARVVAKSIPASTLDPLIGALVKKFGVKSSDFQWSPSSDSVNKIDEDGGVGVVKGGNDPRYSMATTGDQNDVNGETLGKEMKAFGLVGRSNPGAAKHQKNVNKSVGKGVNESTVDRLTQMLKGM